MPKGEASLPEFISLSDEYSVRVEVYTVHGRTCGPLARLVNLYEKLTADTYNHGNAENDDVRVFLIQAFVYPGGNYDGRKIIITKRAIFCNGVHLLSCNIHSFNGC